MANDDTPPSLSKRTLGDMLAELRQAAGLTLTDVADRIAVDPGTISRWETGHNAPKVASIVMLGGIYGASGPQVSRMTTLSIQSKTKGVSEESNVPPALRILYASESRARLVQTLQLENLPGLVQTPEYQAALQECQVPISAEAAEGYRALRAERQRKVWNAPVPKMQMIIGPAAMFYLDGMSAHVRNGQIDHLRDVAARPGIDVRVITGPHPGMLGSFTIVTPRGGKPFAYLESIEAGRYLEDGDVVSQYAAVFDAVRSYTTTLEEHLR